VNRYSVFQASFRSVCAVQKSSAILSGSKSVPGLTPPTIVIVGGMDAVRGDAGGDQRLRRAQGGLADREGRQRRHRVVGEATAGGQERAAAGRAQDGRGDLRRDHGAEDIHIVGAPQPFDGGVEDLARVRQGGVVDDDAGGARGAEDPLERLAVAVQVRDVGGDRLDLEAVAPRSEARSSDPLREISVARKPSRPKRRTMAAPTPGPAPISSRWLGSTASGM
jgi:hypothetical protein